VTYAVAVALVAAVVGLPERSVWVEAMVAGFLAGLQRSYQGCQLTRFRAALAQSVQSIPPSQLMAFAWQSVLVRLVGWQPWDR